ncbi:MAG: cupredoxin domain-containing protein [Acidobacteria bacterium]|nr:cupredoxin domain-containing protein [Acidobacteriota bacterium]MBI3263496.1 cupredoxin domain-containing protein [Acidobacteriota bacterium]
MRVRSITVAVLVLTALVAILPLLATAARQQPREITLVAKKMAFYVEGRPVPNPIIHLKPGERVRLTLKNEDKGVLHDFAIRDLGVGTPTLRGAESASVVFDVPPKTAEYRYVCRPHSKMMGGRVAVE